ncbi:MAG: hypothetical protein LKG11_01255 [Bacilli bacterium]|jgi:hypothetical protein|nr:hypothetical protein [Bacilli bacterium]
MKKVTKNATFALLVAFALVGAASCSCKSVGTSGESAGTSGGNSGSPTPSAQVFKDNKAYYDTSADAYDISVETGLTGEVTSVKVGRSEASADQYSFDGNGVLTLSGSFLSSLNAGEKEVSLVAGGKKATVDLFMATKVIKTADEFQAINDNLTGYYVLGNDIDLSSIQNFEPLGKYWSETDTNNAYFHGILEGNGHSIKNANVLYSDSAATNYNVYSNSGNYKFDLSCHSAGDNIGLFQIIGSSGVVRDCNFKNIKVRGRTICGVIAGNCSGTVYNCHIDSSCSVEMGTHFYDDDCNMGGAFGIVAGTGNVHNVVSEVTNLRLGASGSSTVNGVSVEKAGIYLDWNDDYIGQIGNGWDHGEGTDNPWWKFCAVDKVNSSNAIYTDSNGSATNGEYAFVGKCWGSVNDCVAKAFNVTPMDGSARAVYFGQTHLGVNKPTSGESDLGSLKDDVLLDSSGLKTASNYANFDNGVWNIEDGSVPSLNAYYEFE